MNGRLPSTPILVVLIVYGIVLFALGWALVASPFKEYTDRYDSITMPDYLTARFRDKSHVVRWFGFAVIMSMVAAYTAAQLTATGKAFNSFVGTSYEAGVILGAIIILYYTAVGGFKAVAYSDLLQGAMMFAGLAIMPFVGFAAAEVGMPSSTRSRPKIRRCSRPWARSA